MKPDSFNFIIILVVVVLVVAIVVGVIGDHIHPCLETRPRSTTCGGTLSCFLYGEDGCLRRVRRRFRR